jgi:hypothetical protein
VPRPLDRQGWHNRRDNGTRARDSIADVWPLICVHLRHLRMLLPMLVSLRRSFANRSPEPTATCGRSRHRTHRRTASVAAFPLRVCVRGEVRMFSAEWLPAFGAKPLRSMAPRFAPLAAWRVASSKEGCAHAMNRRPFLPARRVRRRRPNPSRCRACMMVGACASFTRVRFPRLLRRGGFLRLRRALVKGQPIGTNFVPSLNRQAVALEKFPDLVGSPLEDILKNRHKDTRRIFA